MPHQERAPAERAAAEDSGGGRGRGGVGGAQGRAAALPGRTVRAEALRPAAQVAARVPGERAEAGLWRGRAALKVPRGCSVPSPSAARAPAARAFRTRASGCRVGKGPPAVQRPPRPPPPVRVRRSPARRRRGGRDWARSEVGRDLEKPPRLHCSGRGRPEEPVPRSRLPAGRSRSAVPRCLDLPGPGGSAWRGRGARLRGGPRPAG